MILSLIFGFITGIFAGSFAPVTLGLIGAFFVFGMVFYLYGKYQEDLSAPAGKIKNISIIISLFIIGLSVGLLRIHFSDLNQQSKLVQFVGQKVSAEGIVVDEPDCCR